MPMARYACVPARPFALIAAPTLVEELPRLRAALGGGPRLLVKRDDAIGVRVRRQQGAEDAPRRGGRAVRGRPTR